jgi:hypothetical protein
MMVTGMGIGASMSVLTQSAIHHFDMRQRGAATSSVVFLRSLGMTIGITVFGVIQRNAFLSRLGAAAGSSEKISGEITLDPRSILTPELRAQIPPEMLDPIRNALSTSIADTFLWGIVPAVLAMVSVMLMTGDRVKTTKGAAGEKAVAK